MPFFESRNIPAKNLLQFPTWKWLPLRPEAAQGKGRVSILTRKIEAQNDTLMFNIVRVPAVVAGGRVLRVAVDQLAAAITSRLSLV
jgi:hypothetical protein